MKFQKINAKNNFYLQKILIFVKNKNFNLKRVVSPLKQYLLTKKMRNKERIDNSWLQVYDDRKCQHKPTEKQWTKCQRFCSTFNFAQPHPKPTHHPTTGQWKT